ncbi:Cubilin [Amphibalanus amphitrite]|uniref:Cubilin n=1 Tax=Amphibalanus amphitrite TaxID=1232801 RepID=A0A6A4UZQ3_AMPAM|nr:Cubilin [Amphibalanus amphitrite]
MKALAVLFTVVSLAVAKPPPESDPTILFGVGAARSELGCGSHTLTAGTYTIKSPNYPANYGNNVDCAYNLAPGADVTSFKVECSAFNLESHSSCNYDWLMVGGAKYCGTTGPSVTKVGALELSFHSDYSVTSTGYQCTITAQAGGTPQELACGSHTVAPGLYSIKSPGYPSNYGNNLDCAYTITPGSGVNTMTLACCQFEIEYNSSCGWDWLRVNGVKYCGRQGPALSESGAYTIDFHSDYSVVKAGYYCEVRATP